MALIRSLVEAIAWPLVFRRRLAFGAHRVPIVASPSAGLRYLFKANCGHPELIDFAQAYVKPGAVVWDVGANMGVFSFAAAAVAGSTGRVVAFEPDTWLVLRLRESARIQPASSAPVRVVPCAVSAANGLREFTIARRARSSNHLTEYGHSQAGGAAETQTVPAISLDWALEFLPPPDVIKIDVEGAEEEVLRGAAKVLARGPTILCEVSGEASAAVTELLAGYRLRDGESGEPTSRATWSTIAVFHGEPV